MVQKPICIFVWTLLPPTAFRSLIFNQTDRCTFTFQHAYWTRMICGTFLTYQSLQFDQVSTDVSLCPSITTEPYYSLHTSLILTPCGQYNTYCRPSVYSQSNGWINEGNFFYGQTLLSFHGLMHFQSSLPQPLIYLNINIHWQRHCLAHPITLTPEVS